MITNSLCLDDNDIDKTQGRDTHFVEKTINGKLKFI